MSEYSFILDEMLWSFSSIDTYENCPYNFYLNYIEKHKQKRNSFSDYGSFCHKLLEDYFKGNLLSFELYDKFNDEYMEKVLDAFPPIRGGGRLYDSYYESGKEYFYNTDNLDKITDTYDILGVEHRHKFKIDKYNFTGILDLELKNKKGWYEIGDHKSKGKQTKTRLSKKDNPNDWTQLTDGRYIPFHLIKQLYIYSKPFYETYKEYPKYLNLNMFRIGDWYTVEFNEKDYIRSLNWAKDTINKIYNDNDWKTNKKQSDYFCRNICGAAEFCKYNEKYIEGC